LELGEFGPGAERAVQSVQRRVEKVGIEVCCVEVGKRTVERGRKLGGYWGGGVVGKGLRSVLSADGGKSCEKFGQ